MLLPIQIKHSVPTDMFYEPVVIIVGIINLAHIKAVNSQWKKKTLVYTKPVNVHWSEIKPSLTI